MDTRSQQSTAYSLKTDKVVVVGFGECSRQPGDRRRLDPRPYLTIRKNRKFMGVQDSLAVLGAGAALESASLTREDLGERCGLYLAVGYIPFEQDDLDALYEGSGSESGKFSMEAFSTTGIQSVSPLLTFRCLPNMPAFHVSLNFNIQGPYVTTYPGPGQFHAALEEALVDLNDGRIDRAVVGGVAHQQNFLVERHFLRLPTPIAADELWDVAAFLVLQREEDMLPTQSAKARLEECQISYEPHEAFKDAPTFAESFECDRELLSRPGELGPASLPYMLTKASSGKRLRHSLSTRDGMQVTSTWLCEGKE